MRATCDLCGGAQHAVEVDAHPAVLYLKDWHFRSDHPEYQVLFAISTLHLLLLGTWRGGQLPTSCVIQSLASGFASMEACGAQQAAVATDRPFF